MKTILVTGAVGFIGFHTSLKILKNHLVIGIDNINNYYSQKLKIDRLKILKKNKNFKFYKIDIKNLKKLEKIFLKYKPDIVINLAAQAGVRYSLKYPKKYLSNNINGFFNILECCRNFNVKLLIYGSSSSVYGIKSKGPFDENYSTDKPISIYAATKKTNEMMADTYKHLYRINCIGLRFFTVYGPWGRPDMALFDFVKKIYNKKSITVYNRGNLLRDFTFIDDVVESISKLIDLKSSPIDNLILNVGNSKPVLLRNFIKEIEENLKVKANIKFQSLPLSDVKITHSNSSKLYSLIRTKPNTNYKIGIKKFIAWYKEYYKL
ncbi:NAD-dependent epimerase/dehydratase family protein [Candidatus Pelagibacter sp. HIMB1611]|uniref:NAD-dependent epimerase/dehydratase family protein n=1 Tax=unclassified Candidatus Pelagibacter TaxID=2647897 RepID=UPI003F84272B